MYFRHGRYIIHWRWFRIYWNGSFSKLEIDFGKAGGWELSMYFWTLRGKMIIQLNPSLWYLEQKIRERTPNCL